MADQLTTNLEAASRLVSAFEGVSTVRVHSHGVDVHLMTPDRGLMIAEKYGLTVREDYPDSPISFSTYSGVIDDIPVCVYASLVAEKVA